MPTTVGLAHDAVIIGAGIYGLSTALHLKRIRPEWSVRVLEAGALAEEAITSNTSGVIRHSYSHPDVHAAAAYGLPYFRCPAESMQLVGACSVFTGVGWARALNESQRPGSADMAARIAETSAALGLPSEVLGVDEFLSRQSPERLRNLEHCFDRKDYTHVIWEPDGGWADGGGMLRLFAEACRRAGVEISVRRRVTGFEVAGGRVLAVQAGAEVVPARVTVIAAGLWLPHLVEIASGFRMPVLPSYHQVVIACSSRQFPIEKETVEVDGGLRRTVAALPVFSYWRDSYYRPEGEGVLVGMHHYELQNPSYGPSGGRLPDGRQVGLEQPMLDALTEQSEHVPLLAQGSLQLGDGPADLSGGWYVMNPEEYPFEGEVPGTAGSLYVAGSGCGTGFKLGPAVGRLLAERLAGVPRPERLLASSALSAERAEYFFPSGTSEAKLRRLFRPRDEGGRSGRIGASGVSLGQATSH